MRFSGLEKVIYLIALQTTIFKMAKVIPTFFFHICYFNKMCCFFNILVRVFNLIS